MPMVDYWKSIGGRLDYYRIIQELYTSRVFHQICQIKKISNPFDMPDLISPNFFMRVVHFQKEFLNVFAIEKLSWSYLTGAVPLYIPDVANSAEQLAQKMGA